MIPAQQRNLRMFIENRKENENGNLQRPALDSHDRPREIKVVGKLIEELGELQSALARCLIQGIGGVEPVSGKRNVAWLCEELADVSAGIQLCHEQLGLHIDPVRVVTKLTRQRRWVEDLKY